MAITNHERATAPWVKDQTWHSSQKLTTLKDGQLKMLLEVSDIGTGWMGIAFWLWSAGHQAEVAEEQGMRRS